MVDLKFPQLAIFDCDGVLVDSELLACGAVASSLSEIGIGVTTEDIVSRYAGISADAMYQDLEVRFGRGISPEIREAIQRRVLAEFERDLHPMPGVDELLRSLSCPACVASSSSLQRIEFSLRRTSLIQYFSKHIFSATQVAKGKPAPDLFLLTADRMKATPAKCIVIEDSVSGITAANTAGMYAIGFIGGSHFSTELANRLGAANARILVDGMQELKKVLTNLRHKSN